MAEGEPAHPCLDLPRFATLCHAAGRVFVARDRCSCAAPSRPHRAATRHRRSAPPHLQPRSRRCHCRRRVARRGSPTRVWRLREQRSRVVELATQCFVFGSDLSHAVDAMNKGTHYIAQRGATVLGRGDTADAICPGDLRRERTQKPKPLSILFLAGLFLAGWCRVSPMPAWRLVQDAIPRV